MFNFRKGFYADIRIEDRFTTDINYKNGVAEQCRELQEKKAFLRVFDGKMWYYASTDNVNDLQRELDDLYDEYDIPFDDEDDDNDKKSKKKSSALSVPDSP